MDWDEYLKICEWPFVHEGMSFEEYVEEQKYFLSNHEAYRRGDYLPLWKQKTSLEKADDKK